MLMICAIVYEYRSLPSSKDIESSNVSNNNDKTNDFMDKNLNQERRISMGQENDQELIEKGAKQKENPTQRKDCSQG